MAMCPATGEPHTFQQESDDVHGRYVKCTECQAGESILPPLGRGPRPPRRTEPLFDQPDEWSLR